MPLTPDELRKRAEQRAHRDIATLLESGLPVTEEVVRAMARRAAEEDAMQDAQEAQQEAQEAPDTQKPSWIGRLFHR